MNDSSSDTMESSCTGSGSGYYNLPLHVGVLFIIMACSFCGTMLPILGKRFNLMKMSEIPFYCTKMFGSGVILATALVHMLIPADQSLSNPCLPKVFSEDYTAFAGAFCLLGMLSMHLLQFMISKRLRKSHEHVHEVDIEKTATPKDVEKQQTTEQEEGDHHEHGHGLILSKKERHVSTYILEMGIASHSIIVGIVLGVSRDPEFKSLIIALVFHQFFEGMALSSVVLDSDFSRRFAAIAMVTFYTLTTPIGVAIGIGISSTFNENSPNSLLTIGILDAFAAGILLYDALVNIISPHFATDKFKKSSELSQGLQLFFLWFGAAIMALIGRWA